MAVAVRKFALTTRWSKLNLDNELCEKFPDFN